MIVYKTTNLVNGKIYVGQTKRDDKNYMGSGVRLQYAIKKYGKENFIRETLEVCKDIISLNDSEIYWIKLLDARNPNVGYNFLSGGQNGNTRSTGPRKPMSEEQKQQISNTLKGRKLSAETRKNMSEALKLTWKDGTRSREHIQSLGGSKSGWKHTEEAKKKIGDANRNRSHKSGWKHTDEAKKKIGDANRKPKNKP